MKELDRKEYDQLCLTNKQRRTIDGLESVYKVWVGIGSQANSSCIYVNCSKGIAAIGDNGKISWQR